MQVLKRIDLTTQKTCWKIQGIRKKQASVNMGSRNLRWLLLKQGGNSSCGLWCLHQGQALLVGLRMFLFQFEKENTNHAGHEPNKKYIK